MSRYRVEAIVVPFKPEFQMAVKENLAIVSEALSTNFLFGIASQKGHKLIVKYLQNKNNKLAINSQMKVMMCFQIFNVTYKMKFLNTCFKNI